MYRSKSPTLYTFKIYVYIYFSVYLLKNIKILFLHFLSFFYLEIKIVQNFKKICDTGFA